VIVNVLSNSNSFNQFIKKTIDSDIETYSKFLALTHVEDIYLIHAPSMGKETIKWINQQNKIKHIKCIVCDDKPKLTDMLSAVSVGAKAYCNSYMQKDNFEQMIRLVSENQSWFPPQMLAETFKLADQLVNNNHAERALSDLTEKEKEISLSIGKGYSNQEIASHLNITESTVKTHLTHIYKKLNIKDRVALVLHMGSNI